MNWKTYPMGAAAAERMELRGLKACLDHAVNLDTMRPVCGKVKLHSLCMDDSLATRDLPDCPTCRAKLEKLPAPRFKVIRESASLFSVFDTETAIYVFSGTEPEAEKEAIARNGS